MASAMHQVAEFTCACERYVGTQSGGMDQAISIMGEKGLAKLVDFNPIRAHDVQLPGGLTFVIANSLAVSNKAETADGRYNLRVVECRLAASCLAVALGHSAEKAKTVTTLSEIEPLIVQHANGSEACNTAMPNGVDQLELCEQTAEKLLHSNPYTQAEIEEILKTRLEDILNPTQLRVISCSPLLCCTVGSFATSPLQHGPSCRRGLLSLTAALNSGQVLPVAAERGGFSLQARALHVFAEASRVRKFRDVCEKNVMNSPGSLEYAKKSLGELMDASHASLSNLYECSCPELNELVKQCRKAGALGSRLTGAGWGGCTVSMVADGQVQQFLATLRSGYYAECQSQGRITAEQAEAENVLFVSKPSAGGAILRNLRTYAEP
mmetsp:Transcript_12996/g.36556  ORF Transcript_12996/g.36556 Transcript_12996/m.36556 type:complete len:381 (-) Transcript_12996:382-1524(-)